MVVEVIQAEVEGGMGVGGVVGVLAICIIGVE